MKRLSVSAGKFLAIATACILTLTVYDAQAQRSRGGMGGGGGFRGGSSMGGFRGGSSGGFRGPSMGSFNRGPSVSSGIRSRGGFTSSYRPAPRYYGGSRFGYGYGYHPYFGYNRFYGNYYNYYAPYLGLSFGFLPWGYSSFYYGPNLFYYNNGLFYRQYDDGDYHVVEPPIGAEVKKLPRKAKQVTVDGQQYFEKDGVYYQPVTKDNGKVMYKVTGKDGDLSTGTGENGKAMVGDVVDSLPAETRIVTLNGQKYYVSQDDVYYQELNDGSKIQYKVVRTPESEMENEPEKQ